MLTHEELAQMSEMAEKATPGKWFAYYIPSQGWRFGTVKRYERLCNGDIGCIAFYQARPGNDGGPVYTEEQKEKDRADAEFIAHARTDMPRLLDEVERLQKENELMRINLMSIQGFCQEPSNREDAPYLDALEILEYLGGLASIALGEGEKDDG